MTGLSSPDLGKFSHCTLSLVPSTSQRSPSTPKRAAPFELEVESRNKRKTRKMLIRPAYRSNVQAQYPKAGLCFVQTTSRLANRHLMLAVNRIMDKVLCKLFYVSLPSFPLRLTHLSKNTVMGYALEVPERTLSVQDLEPHAL